MPGKPRKTTPEQDLEIRALYAAGGNTTRRLAEQFKVDHGTIQDRIKGLDTTINQAKKGARPIESRFWENFTVSGIDECWIWRGWKDVHGYGKIYVLEQKKDVGAHRVAWELAKGPIPDGLFVLHKCDNPPCMNPEHLFLGTHGDNMRDCAKKGRFWNEERRLKYA